MTERLVDVEARLRAVRDLQGIVQALRTLAASRLHQAEAALPALRAYAGTVTDALVDGLALVGRAPPLPSAPEVVVVLCAEHGFAGGFSRRALEVARSQLAASAAVFVLGSRGVAAAAEAGVPVAWCAPMASQAGAVGDTAGRVAAALLERSGSGALGGLAVVGWRATQGGRHTPERRTLLPLAAPPRPSSRPAPLIHLSPAALVEGLVAEWVLAALAEAVLESLAAENAARLATLQAAREHIDRALEELRGEERRLRQEAITAELLDVVTGAMTAAG